MKVNVESNKNYQYDKSIYTYPTKLEKQYMNKENAFFGKAKLQIKNELLKNLSKDIKNKRYIINPSRLRKISNSLYDEINDLNMQLFLEVVKYSYSKTFDDNDNDVTEKKKKQDEPTETVLNNWLNEFFSGAGLNYIYAQEILRRSDYFNTQITNVIMSNVNNKISSSPETFKTNSDVEKFIRENLNMNSNDILSEIKRQKKAWGQITDDTMAILINKSNLRAFETMGIKKVVRVAIIDDKTCSDCKRLNGTVYDIDNIPQLIIHRNDRCIYKVYVGN